MNYLNKQIQWSSSAATFRTAWYYGEPLSEYMAKNRKFFGANKDPVFICRGKYLHKDSVLDRETSTSEDTVTVTVSEGVYVGVELYNNSKLCRGVVMITRGSTRFSDIKKECERDLLLTKDMPIIGWKVNDCDVSASDKVFDHVTNSKMRVTAVIQALSGEKILDG